MVAAAMEPVKKSVPDPEGRTISGIPLNPSYGDHGDLAIGDPDRGDPDRG